MEDIQVVRSSNKGIIKFLAFSAIGIGLFFIPVNINETNAVPLVHLVSFIKSFIGAAMNYLVLIVSVLLSITYLASKRIKTTSGFLAKLHEKDSRFTGALYLLSSIFAVLLIFNMGPEQILNPDVGGLAIYLAGSVLITVTVAGWLVIFLIEFGFLEFLGTLLEPIMRVAFKLPGRASVDALASFVSAPAVGVFITNKLYTGSTYTDKEACCITTNFSVCSLGFFALLVSIGDIVEYYPHVILSSLLIVFIMAAIVIRIPPLSRKKDTYFNGKIQTEEERKSERYDGNTFSRALASATQKAEGADMRIIFTSLPEAFLFAIKIVTFVLSIAVVSLLIATYTPVFDWMGKPMVPLLNLLRIPDAAQIASATLVGVAEIALPVLIIAGKGISEMSVFFIIVLSTVQIIFFTESANAMLESNMPLNFFELIAIFLIRTLIALPLVAAATFIIF